MLRRHQRDGIRTDIEREKMADDISKRIARFIEPFRVSPGSSVTLATDFDPGFKAGIEKKKDGVDLLKGGIELLAQYQARLAAQDTYGVLVVLQALDAAGKDGTIRHVMSGVNPQGVRVESFKVPSALELDQDFLRRYQQRLPLRGEIGIFNRSHYEEVLVVRVHPENLLREKLPVETREHHVWARRYDAINDWERYLSDNGFRIVKLFLNLSREEQRVRFLRRIDLPDHNWKFSSHDVEERQSWDAYQEAFSEMFSHTSTTWAPWYVIPADRKWFARIAAAAVIANALIEIDPQYPRLGDVALRDLETAKRRLEAEAPNGVAADPFEPRESGGNGSNGDHAVPVTPSGTPAQQEG
jgi:PPK2 family polyphosphate:nucleotide phosphotransferase